MFQCMKKGKESLIFFKFALKFFAIVIYFSKKECMDL